MQLPVFQSKHGVSFEVSSVEPLNSSENETFHCLPLLAGAGGAGRQFGGVPTSPTAHALVAQGEVVMVVVVWGELLPALSSALTPTV